MKLCDEMSSRVEVWCMVPGIENDDVNAENGKIMF